MPGSLFRRLLLTAAVLVAATLFAVDYTLTRYAALQQASSIETRRVRQQVLAISFGAAALALGIACLVSRSLSRRVTRLKRLAEGMLGGVTADGPSYDSSDELGSLERSLTGVARELRKLVDRLRFESARREAILAGMAEGVLAVDPDLRVTFCNQAFLRAIGFRGESFERLSLLELARDPALHELIRGVVAKGEPGKLRFHLSAATP